MQRPLISVLLVSCWLVRPGATIPLRTHPNGKTTIEVTAENTLNTTVLPPTSIDNDVSHDVATPGLIQRRQFQGEEWYDIHEQHQSDATGAGSDVQIATFLPDPCEGIGAPPGDFPPGRTWVPLYTNIQQLGCTVASSSLSATSTGPYLNKSTTSTPISSTTTQSAPYSAPPDAASDGESFVATTTCTESNSSNDAESWGKEHPPYPTVPPSSSWSTAISSATPLPSLTFLSISHTLSASTSSSNVTSASTSTSIISTNAVPRSSSIASYTGLTALSISSIVISPAPITNSTPSPTSYVASTYAAPSNTSIQASSYATSNGSTAPSATPSAPLTISLVNKLPSSAVNAYITGLDYNDQLVLLTTDNTFYYPSAPASDKPVLVEANIAIPLTGANATTQIIVPSYLSDARIWIADGELQFSVFNTPDGIGLIEPSSANMDDPSADVNWGFVEFTWVLAGGLVANLSFVNFVGLPLGLQLITSTGGVQSALGLPKDAVAQMCSKLTAQSLVDGHDWDALCVTDTNGNLIRVVSPFTLISNNASTFETYWTGYVDKIWNQYKSSHLFVDLQSSLGGNVSCIVDSDDLLTCTGDNRPYSKPSAGDIFSCSTGPFNILASDNDIHSIIVPRLCAAFNRATLHLPGGNLQPSLPPSRYYTSRPNNWYSKIVHELEVDGMGYAFPYDDVAPNIFETTDGLVYDQAPASFTIYVGGYD